MFKLVISQSNLQGIIGAVSHLNPEAKLQIAEDSIKIEAVDPANVAMVFLQASSGAFEFFKATPMDIALDLQRLSELTTGKDAVSLTLDEETHKLKIEVGRAKYTMSLIDPTAIKGAPRVPQLDLPAAVAMSGSDLRDAIASAAKVSDHVVLEQHESQFIISAKGDIDAFSMPFELAELTGIRNGESRALFSLEYISVIAKAARGSDNVLIETGIDYPATITFNIGESINIRYLMAPRIEQE